MNTSDILNAAADKIERDGLWKDGPGGDWGGRATCIALSVVEVAHVSGEQEGCIDRLLMSAIGGSCLKDVFAWNDAPERTKADVVALLRACAAIERASKSAYMVPA